MQVFLFGALAVSLVAVLFALQNIVPVTVSFLGYSFQGSLALVLFVAFVAGALASFLASLPALFKGKWNAGQHRRQVVSLESTLADCQRKLRDVESRLEAGSTHPPAHPGDTKSTIEPTT